MWSSRELLVVRDLPIPDAGGELVDGPVRRDDAVQCAVHDAVARSSGGETSPPGAGTVALSDDAVGVRAGMAAWRWAPGRVALALAGSFDGRAVARLRVLRPQLQPHATDELVVELIGLTDCPPSLARAVARLRVAALTRGTRVELRHVPGALRVELGHAPAEAFTVRDAPPSAAPWSRAARWSPAAEPSR